MVSLEFLKGATRGLRKEWIEGNLKGDYLRLMPGLCLEDRMNSYASSRWRRVIWLVLGGRLWSNLYIGIILYNNDFYKFKRKEMYIEYDSVFLRLVLFPPLLPPEKLKLPFSFIFSHLKVSEISLNLGLCLSFGFHNTCIATSGFL